MNAYQTIRQFAKTLRQMDAWIEKATTHAKAKSFDPNVLVNARLAPDQYPLVRQVQASCDTAKFAAAYLAGKQAPAHPDTEQTIPEIRQRIQTCLAYVDTFKEADFTGADDRKIAPPWMQGKWLRGADYMLELAIPNFYFHATTAYALLRHNGVDVGKMDFIGSLPTKDG
jgi:hypothetical protein